MDGKQYTHSLLSVRCWFSACEKMKRKLEKDKSTFLLLIQLHSSIICLLTEGIVLKFSALTGYKTVKNIFVSPNVLLAKHKLFRALYLQTNRTEIERFFKWKNFNYKESKEYVWVFFSFFKFKFSVITQKNFTVGLIVKF